MQVIFNPDKQRVPIKSWADDADEETMRQTLNLANLPFVVSHVALMPDAHVGFGMPIGGVIAVEGAIVPNAVGVDIGCGMVAWKTGIAAEKLRPYLQGILDYLHQNIPLGFKHRTPNQGESLARKWCPEFLELFSGKHRKHAYLSGYEKIVEQLGTLGGGNHFLEVQEDPEGGAWVMVHSGSRNVGLQINAHYHRLAKQLCKRAGTTPADPGLSYLPLESKEGQDYIEHMRFALDFARYNRHVMMRHCQQAVRQTPAGGEAAGGDELVNIHHNYAALEDHFGKKVWVHRKGATSARAGQLGIIPGSMGTKSYIVRGKGSPDSFTSCSHGAGRVMGRTEARGRIPLNRFKETMQGVLFQCTPRHLDEAPDAYKDLDRVMANQADLVETVVELRPQAVIKG
jgi:tRNA-splicing ligase RtcB